MDKTRKQLALDAIDAVKAAAPRGSGLFEAGLHDLYMYLGEVVWGEEREAGAATSPGGSEPAGSRSA